MIKKRKKLLVVTFLSIFVLTVSIVYASRTMDSCSIDRERHYQLVQAKVLAHYLARGGFGKGLVIHHPVSAREKSDSVDRIVEGFRIGFGGFVTEIVTEPIKNINGLAILEEGMTEITADDFNKVIKKHPDCDIIITMVPLPFAEDELYKIDIFNMIEDPQNPGLYIKDPNQRYPRLGVYNGYIGNLVPLFEEKLIAAMTIWRPNPVIDEKPIPTGWAEAFYKRYIIIAPEFIERSKVRYPSLFPKPRRQK